MVIAAGSYLTHELCDGALKGSIGCRQALAPRQATAASVAAVFFHNEAVEVFSAGCRFQPLTKAAVAKQSRDAG